MAYKEPKDPLTGKGKRHSASAKKVEVANYPSQLNVQDIIYKQSPMILKRKLDKLPGVKLSDLKRVKLSSIIPSQHGEDYKNASSEYEAEQFQKVLNGELTYENVREEDYYPILVDKDTNKIIDGNHRHYALSKINSPYAVVLYV